MSTKIHHHFAIVFLIILSSLFFFSAPSPATENSPVAEDNSVIKSGTYLISEYVDMLEKTRSPYEALISCPEPCVVNGIEGGWQASSFHEYYDCHGTGMAGPEGELPYDVSITVDGDNLILTGCAGKGPLHYIYVGNARRYVAKKVIVGDYVDSEGKHYSFKEDGTAVFGNVKFEYEIGLDFAERWHTDKDLKMRDYFQNSKTRELYEFEIKDDVLSIYRTSGDMFSEVEPEPFLKLKKMSK